MKVKGALRYLLPLALDYTFHVSLSLAEESDDVTRFVSVDVPDLGRVQGKRQSGTDFFGGVPYAAPPVGNLRWEPPEPVTPWAPATLDATRFGPDCWQVVDPLMNPTADVDQMSEDCLYLNIYTPAGQAAHNEKLPVMVWLHGGAFQQGGARRPEYDGRRLTERKTVVVTLNYRLGALGFLVSSSDGLFGNFGLMDQRAAMHWVKDHIRHFGGDPENVTLFGESAGAVMTVLHLMMDGAGYLFHKAIIQSNPLGLQLRSVVVADFLGEALKSAVDCRDLPCLKSERVEEIIRAQSSLMGVPRSVGDFFTWVPTLSDSLHLNLGLHKAGTLAHSPIARDHEFLHDLESWKWRMNRDTAWAAVNVTQPLRNLDRIPLDIPIIIGANKNEGEMFVHGAFPITMSKAVYWLFVGALFRDSASRVLKHYRGYVDTIEKEAQSLALRQVEEEENRQYYQENQENLERQYEQLLNSNTVEINTDAKKLENLVEAWSRGGETDTSNSTTSYWHQRLWPLARNTTDRKSTGDHQRLREERRKARSKARSLKAASKVAVDYRPVMSRIIDDYLFRCPSWHLAQQLSRNRLQQGHSNNIYVYQFSHSTHVPGFKECWGKACHTAEIPYVFEAMDIIRTNYSTLGPYARLEAPKAPEYPYTNFLSRFRQAMEQQTTTRDGNHPVVLGDNNNNSSFHRIIGNLFGDYFREDADEEIANDMANRWSAFARTGNPNYGESRATWRPWRYVFDEYKRGMGLMGPWKPLENGDFRDVFRLDNIGEEVSGNSTRLEGYAWSGIREERIFRRRILQALGMEVASEDVYHTKLRRTVKNGDEQQSYLLSSVLFGSVSQSHREGSREQRRTRKALTELQRIAQDMRIMGTGLRSVRRRGKEAWEDDFFPQILELKWPPDDQLIERDCTCDMWDRIRCK